MGKAENLNPLHLRVQAECMLNSRLQYKITAMIHEARHVKTLLQCLKGAITVRREKPSSSGPQNSSVRPADSSSRYDEKLQVDARVQAQLVMHQTFTAAASQQWTPTKSCFFHEGTAFLLTTWSLASPASVLSPRRG
ncbi:unnamed protein product [Phytophthora lilii]|uniref:Unnamed protein product n=1 Tax=Phytophthora lilii TaxID=2077276 RepID=A0A9W6TZI2_9STRA|nr:unnamed protein product [Phytophthora lilii]